MSASADQDQGRNPSLKYFTRSTVAIYGRAVVVRCKVVELLQHVLKYATARGCGGIREVSL